ncbi:phage tail tape measure protein [Flammeovirga sp. SJP92]|uniref:phage tail tape measure protein n=1 Tax=Flammeovirga sp. SJP92 TaxID=1775430 RepID=UPI0007883606|nr:phage tail tape measure protein [Flammeovirga sp. SJP92]KXX70604.1 hypothetical protein AVL50_07220 [Flammeovirga sp. SJP92]
MSKRKIQVILDLKDRLSKGITKAKNKVNKTVDGLNRKIGSFKAKNMEMFSAISSEIPGVGRALELLSNPYVAGAVAVAGMIVGVVKLTGHLMNLSKETKTVQTDISTTMGLTGNALKEATADSQALTKVFNVDRRELINSANAMSKEFGISAKESMGIVENALIATNGVIDLDQFREYSTQMKAVGMNADQMAGLVAKAFKDGVYQDKAIDSIKEANLRLKEMPKATQESLSALGLNADEIQKGLKTGALSTIDAIKMVSQKLGESSGQTRQSAIANIFGSPGEDAGEKFLTSLATAEFSMKKMINLQDPFIQKQKERLGLEKELSMKIQAFSGDFNKLSNVFQVAWLKAKILFYDGIGRGIAYVKEMFAPLVSALNTFFQYDIAVAGILLQTVFNKLKFLFNGILEIIRIVVSAVTGFINLFNFARKMLFQFVNWVYEVSGTKSILHKLFGLDESDSITSKIKEIFDGIAIRLEGLTGLAKKSLDVINYGIRGEFSKAKSGYAELKTGLKDVLSDDYVKRQKALRNPTVEKVTQGKKNVNDLISHYDNTSISGGSASNPDTIADKAKASHNITVNANFKGAEQITVHQENGDDSQVNDMLDMMEEMFVRALNNYVRGYG